MEVFRRLWRVISRRPARRPPPKDTFDHSSICLPFDTVVVAGAVALQTREALCDERVTAVIMGGGEDVTLITRLIAESSTTTSAITARAATVDCDAWLQARPSGTAPEGAWPTPAPHFPPDVGLHLCRLSGEPKHNVIIGKVPVQNSFEIPAVLHYGDWNECPAAHIHVALHTRWHQAYGAEIIGISDDTIECTVTRRPASPEEALALAEEHFQYCSDNIVQGCETLQAYASLLLESDRWYFWWD